MHTRVCPRCGYAGSEIDHRDATVLTAVYVCPRCCEDLYARPAMSYAEREGLPEVVLRGDLTPASPRAARARRAPWWRRVLVGTLRLLGVRAMVRGVHRAIGAVRGSRSTRPPTPSGRKT